MNMREQPTVFVVILRPTIAGVDSIEALRAVLKFGLRRFGLRCTDAREICDRASPDEPVRAPAILTDGTRSRSPVQSGSLLFRSVGIDPCLRHAADTTAAGTMSKA